MPKSHEAQPWQPWQPRHFSGITMHGWAWGFWLPVKTGQTAETCCGFRTKEAALAAALALSTGTWTASRECRECQLRGPSAR
ncbi:MAG: hypothetical protein IPK22_11050 [Verrucomicrobiaceae bacterium]|nr:hypothetical protein [Verrucomicrobiaceae bacterium]